MDTTTTKTKNSLTLSREDLTNRPLAFELKPSQREATGELSRVIASSFIKYTQKGIELSPEVDSVDSFIDLYHLHQSLLDSAESFLTDEMPFVPENRPINELLLAFATYRLTKASRAYYFESLTARDPEDTQRLKNLVQSAQRDFDNLLQSL